MKIRTGFVSNSSSSSFVIATGKDKKTLKITLEIDLTGETNSWFSPVKERYETKEAYLNAVRETHYVEGDSEEEITEEYPWVEDALKALEAGKVIYELQGSSEDGEALSQLIYDGTASKLLKHEEDIEVILDND